MARITVCIPTYNRREFLREALDSVFAQTWTDFEVLVVDDGSTDGTAEMIEGYGRPVRYLYQENRGDAAARNRLLAETRTPLVAWLDSDDLWLPEKLQRQLRLLESRDERTIVFGPKLNIEPDGRLVTGKRPPPPAGRITTELFENIFIPTPSVLMPADLLREAGGFDERYRVCSDYRTWLILSLTCDFVATAEPLVKCRRHLGSLSRESSANQCVKISMLEEFYFELGGKEAVPQERAMRRLATQCRKAGDLLRGERNRPEALLYYRKSIDYHRTLRAMLGRLAAQFGR
ncbi:MAG: glycosyltransferase [Anaerolineaceae bacterium]|nr:glycosyltransferase [Anaerolineaceae bacterium]